MRKQEHKLSIREFLLLFLVCCSFTTNAQTFTSKAPYMGQWAFAPGVAHKPTNSIYIPGAYAFGDIDQFARYNVSTNTWSTVGGLPAIKSEFGFAFGVNNRIFFGGGVDQPGTFTNVVYEFIPPGIFNAVDNIPIGPASGFSFSIGNFGYVGNGLIAGFGNLNAMYRFDPLGIPGTQWSTMTAYPGAGKINCSAASLNGFGYAGLGRSNPGSSVFTDFWRYDPSSGAGGTWTPMASFPGSARECAMLAPFCNKLILMGGGNIGTNVFSQEYWEFDPAIGPTGTWTLLGTNPAVFGPQSGRYGEAFASYGDSLFFGMGFGVSNVNTDWNMFTYCPAILKMDLLDFSARADDQNHVQLRWKTSNEINPFTFIVEQSTDEISWKEIGRLNANGNSHGPIEYNLTDAFPSMGANHYRLIHSDLNGTRSYLGEVTVYITENPRTDWFVFPNPANEFISVAGRNYSENLQYKIIGIEGVEKFSGELNEDHPHIPVKNLSQGIYFIILDDEVNSVVRFVKE